MSSDWQLQTKIKNLESLIESSRTALKNKLARKNVSYDTNASLRALIRLIPRAGFTPMHLYETIYSHRVVSINSYQVLFAGGRGGSSGWRHYLYDIQARSHIGKANLPVDMIGHDGAIWGSTIMYCGGNGSAAKCNYTYNLTSNVFTRRADLPESRSGHVLVATRTYLFISGGIDGSLIRTQYTYNVGADLYESRTNSHHPAKWLSGAYSNTSEAVLLSGGVDVTNSNISVNYRVHASTGTIFTAPNLPSARAEHDSYQGDTGVLILGGVNSANDTMLMYQPTSQTMTTKKTTPKTFRCASIIRVNVDNGEEFLISGGYQNNSVVSRQYAYNPTSDDYRESV